MTLPRRVLPNRTYLVTRRCSERRFFLRPDSVVTAIFEYLLAIACQRHGVQLHAFVCMSNHYHLVLTDVQGTLPAFEQYLNSLLARAINRVRGREEALWNRDSYNAVELLDDDVVFEKLVYTLANPVRAGLVGRATSWEGSTSASMGFGHQREVTRPPGFFSESMPERAVLELSAPSGSQHEQLQAQLRRTLAEIEGETRKHCPKPCGMRAVLRRDWSSSPNTDAPRRSNPRFSARRMAVRIAALVEFSRWVGAYRETMARFKQGERDVDWPIGTYWMVRLGCPMLAG